MNIYSNTNILTLNSTEFFSDHALTQPFNGNLLWWSNTYNGVPFALQINTTGLLVDFIQCSNITTTTTTTLVPTTTTTTSTTTTTHTTTTTTRAPLNISVYPVTPIGIILIGGSIKLTVDVYNGTGNYTYSWSATPSGSKIFGLTTKSPIWSTFSSTGDYTITCTVTDNGLPAGHNTVSQTFTVTVGN